jgi:serine protease SohB
MARLNPFSKRPNTVAVLRLSGVIAAGSRGGLSDQGLAPLIEKAFRRGKPSAVALILNSPGGSPVQSALIGARIRRLAEEKNVPVYAFVEWQLLAAIGSRRRRMRFMWIARLLWARSE